MPQKERYGHGKMSVKIIVDAMSGDYAPDEILRGVCLAAAEYDAEYILVGDEDVIREKLSEYGADPEQFRIVHTDEVISMEDNPISVVREKKHSSMGVSLRLLSDGEGDAMVSAGNTGALYSGAVLVVRPIRGIRRPAIAALLPMKPPVLLLDSGANVNVTPEYLVQFAVMGSVYMQQIFHLECPRVGLLNNGTEPCKGTELQVNTYRLLQSCDVLNFVGNIEASQVPKDACDVLVCDGFTGNILLKSFEGMGGLMIRTMKNMFSASSATKLSAVLLKRQLNQVKKDFDTTEHGGAPILGLRRAVIKAHGSSNAKAIKNAIRQAIAYSATDVSGEIAEKIAMLKDAEKISEEKAKKKEAENANSVC